jgi:tRNA nucleotidyltransferase/poly(A) polymerase
MKRLLIILSFALAISGAVFAQDKSAQSTAILQKMRQIDLLNHLIPLVMTKEQIRKLLPEIEKARRDVRTQEAEEAKLLSEKAAAIDKAVKDGIDKGDVPDKQLLKELNAMIRFFSMKRDAVANDNTTNVLAIMKTTLNAGQLKAAGNSLNPKVFDPSVKLEELKDDDRLRLFVREVMLDPLAYDLLVKMQAGQRG